MRPLGDIFPPELDGLDAVEKGRLLVAALWKPRGGVVIEDRPSDEAPAICPACRTADGWIWSDEPAPGCPVGRMIPCPACREPRMRQRELERMFDDLDLPEEYRTLTPESYADLPRADLEALARVVAVRNLGPSTLYLYGGTGVGKTFFAWHLVCAWITTGATGVLFITAPELLDRLRAGYNDGASVTADEVFEATKRAPVLVLDDIGSSKVTDWVVERLFVLVDYREKHHLPTIYTSNYPIDGLRETLGARTVSRLRKHCGQHVIWVDGVDQRMVVS